jgi:hypothetical protein
MTETPQNAQPKIVTGVDPADLGGPVGIVRVSDDGTVTVDPVDAIGYDHELWKPYVGRWQEAVHKAVEQLSADVQRRVAAFHAFTRVAHNATHDAELLCAALSAKRRVLRRSRLKLVRCPVCHPTANPKPLPRGLGTAYAARRRHR